MVLFKHGMGGAKIAATILMSPLVILAAILSQIFSWIFLRKSAKSITGEVAVVTGGANGLGKEICIQLAIKGCHVAVVDINLVEAEKTASFLQIKYNIKAKAYKVDVTNHDKVMQLSKDVIQDLGVATILVNNAGILMFSSYPNPDWHEVQNMINVNLTAHLWTLEAFLPKMKELKKGHIVAIASSLGLFPLPQHSQYTATKFAVRGLMRALRLELRIDNFKNIHTTTIMPLFLNTNVRCANVFLRSGFSNKYPMIDGTDAAKSIIHGMLLNEMELGLPSVLTLLYGLYELLPSPWQDMVMYFLTEHMSQEFMQELGTK